MPRSQSLVALLSLAPGANAWTPGAGCRKFNEIYDDGKDLIETMWNNAFKYTADENMGYTMWWYEGGTAGTGDGHDNPNDLITQKLGKTVPNQCHLDYFHKDVPSPESDDFTECHPWHANACCHNATVVTPVAIKSGYGPGYEWDRCGPLSQACERFFVEEGCFYECEVNAGLFRKYTDEQHALCSTPGTADGATVTLANGASYTCEVSAWGGNAENKWQLFEMPVRASYADAWYRACAHDLFCGDGDYFACANDYHAQLAAEALNASLTAEAAANKTRETLAALAAEEAQAAQAQAQAAQAAAEAAKLESDLEEEKDKGLEPGIIALIVVLAVLGVGCAGTLLFLVRREKQGRPMFVDLSSSTSSTSNVEVNKA